MLQSGGGSIVNTVSIASLVAFPTMPAYCASKGATLMLTKTAAVEYAAEGIRVNAICPGTVETGMSMGMPKMFTCWPPSLGIWIGFMLEMGLSCCGMIYL